MPEMNDATGHNNITREERREDSIKGVHHRDGKSNDVEQPAENWRRTAELIARETDTTKLMKLADQLLRELDRAGECESRLATATSDSSSIATERQHREGFAQGDESVPRGPEQ